jgi:membrane fusion protein, multidrug efflux system
MKDAVSCNSMLPMALVFVLGLASCGGKAHEEIADDKIRPVHSLVVQAQAPELSRDYPGVVQAIRKVQLSFRVPGVLAELPVTEGQTVEAGDLLAQLDDRDYQLRLEEAQSRLEESKAQLTIMTEGDRAEDRKAKEAQLAQAQAVAAEARANWQRAVEMEKDGLISKTDLSAKQTTMESSAAQVQIARQALNKATSGARQEDVVAMESRQKGLEVQRSEAQAALDDTALKAPFSGRVVAVLVDNFQEIAAGSPIVDLQDLSEIEIAVQVPEVLMRHAQEGARYENTAVFDSAPERTFPLEFRGFSAEADPKTLSYTVTLSMPQPEDMRILPGMTPRVHVRLLLDNDSGPTAILVPLDAVFSDEADQSAVWIIDEGTQTVRMQIVKTGALSNNQITIEGGLEAGSRIVTAGVHYLREGQKVRLLDEESGN